MNRSVTSRARGVEILTVSIAFIVINLASHATQEPISFNRGWGADGIVYSLVA